eukprot:scaffold290_cov367-Pinguiococcus_pyrenoidosus.AAC.2
MKKGSMAKMLKVEPLMVRTVSGRVRMSLQVKISGSSIDTALTALLGTGRSKKATPGSSNRSGNLSMARCVHSGCSCERGGKQVRRLSGSC